MPVRITTRLSPIVADVVERLHQLFVCMPVENQRLPLGVERDFEDAVLPMKAEILVFVLVVHGGCLSYSEQEWSSYDSAYSDGFHNLKRAGVDHLEPVLTLA